MKGENKKFDLSVKDKDDICTIMYTSGTTGDPKGVLISNKNIVTLTAGVRRLLESCNEAVSSIYITLYPFSEWIQHLFRIIIIIKNIRF